jgi:hypothetical protein
VRLLLWILTVFAIVLLAIQLVPYGRDHTNPPTTQEIRWNTPQTRVLAQRACMDCHSNLTEWPWYTSVAPISWLTQREVEDGRAQLNFSEWDKPQEANLQDVLEAIRGNDMPPIQYRAIHKDARLTGNERQQLEAGLAASWAKDPPGK